MIITVIYKKILKVKNYHQIYEIIYLFIIIISKINYSEEIKE